MDKKQMSEAETRSELVNPVLERVGWKFKGGYVKEEVNPVKSKFELKEYVGREIGIEHGVDRFIDYLLLDEDRSPLAVIESKKKLERVIKLDSYKLAKMSKGEIKKLIFLFEQIHKNVKSQKNVLKNKISTFIISLNQIINNLNLFDNEEQNEINRVFNRFKKVGEGVLDIPINFLFLWFLAMITFPHSNWTRYPKDGSKQLGQEEYTKNLGIIGVQDQLFLITERRLINRFEQTLKREMGVKQ
ncbi:MAG: hypothetical protein AABX96_02625 [Nanoarchaeota archaeon]